MKKLFLTILLTGLTYTSFGQELKLHIKLQDSLMESFKTIPYKKNHNNAKSIINEVNLYINKLQYQGYLNSSIVKQLQLKKTFTYTILINKPIETLSINIDNKQDSIINSILPIINIKNNQIHISFSESEALLENIKQKLYELGYTFVKVRLEHINIASTSQARATLYINYSKKRQIDQLIIKGYPDFPKTLIKHQLNYPNDKPLNNETLKDIDNNIQKLPFISVIKPAELLFTKDSTKLYLYIKKKNNSSFQGILGISANKNKKINIYGYLNLKLSNTFNKGELITLDWNKTSSSSQQLKVSSTLPYLFRTPLSSKLYLNISKVDSSYTNTTSEISIYRKKQHLTYGIGYSKLNSKVNNITSNTSNLTQNSLFIYFSYKQISKIAVFKHKDYYYINIKRGKNNTNTINETENEFSLHLAKLLKITEKNYLHLSNNSNYSSSKNEQLTNKNKLIGGINTLKGFSENQFSTNNYSIFDIEYRHLLNNSIYTTINSQIGYLELESSKLSTLSFGTSLNIKQKNGLLSILYDIGKSNESSFKLTNSKINIRFLTFF